jgi:hypothetical protein
MLALPLGWTALFADSPTEAAWFWVAYFVSYFGLALLFRLGAR